MPSPARVGRWLLIGAVAAAYMLLAHFTTIAERPSTFGALLAVGPWMAAALAIAWRAPQRRVLLPAWCAGAAAMALAWPLLRANFAWVYLVQHAGTFAMLSCVFGHTLFGGRMPMVSRFAAMLHGELPPQLARYTRKVTVAWVAFFVAMTVSSLILFFFGPMDVWSALANLLTPILLGVMFAGEYAVRMLVLPPAMRGGLIDSVRVFWRRNEAEPSSSR